ncbi:Protein tpx2 [Coemansia sp. RSA 1365]|nr:Protein tpx2 [Coemansia sp. RSA 1365]
MTKSRRSSQRKSGISGHSPSVKATPARSAKRAADTSFDDNNTDDIWNFDAPQFYDFENSKTPGATADKWFDYAHPTPAPRQSRASRRRTDSLSSTDSRESLLPNCPFLSPSRVVIEADGRLTIDEDHISADEAPHETRSDIDNIKFSDAEEESEFNDWKSTRALTNSKNSKSAESSQIRDSKLSTDSMEAGTAAPSANVDSRRCTEQGTNNTTISARTSDASETSVPKRSGSLRPTTNKGNGRVAKRQPQTTRGSMAPASLLTVPTELGFMRPTKGASQRLAAKQRDKTNKRMVAEAIAKSVSRRLPQEKGSGLTVPTPFQFHGDKNEHGATQAAEGDPAAAWSERRLSRKAQEYLISKLTAKRRLERLKSETDPVGSPKRSSKKGRPTVPKTPQFAKSKRVRRVMTLEDDVAPVPEKRTTQAPSYTHLSPPKPTVPQPFTFRSDAAAEKHLQRLREEISKLQAEQEAMRQFRANPLPEFPTPKKPKRQQSLLHASPFNLRTDSRGENYQRKLKARLEELEQRQRERMQFKAQPIPLSIDQPFVPHPSALPLTEIEEILLRTELRSEERRAYDEDRTERERIREEVLARKRLEEERREMEEIKRLRKILVHKAQPVRHYKPLEINPSDRALTVPKTPKWHVRTRQRPAISPTPSSP